MYIKSMLTFLLWLLWLQVGIEAFPNPMPRPLPWHSLKHNTPKSNILTFKDTKGTAGMGSSTEKYFIIRKRMQWIEAQDQCYHFCTRLATFPTLEKAKFMAEVLVKLDPNNVKKIPKDYFEVKDKYEFGRDRRYWIGLTDLGKEGVWRWSRTNELLTYDDMWYPNQPDHFKKQKLSRTQRAHGSASEHCVSFWNPVFHIETERHTFNDEPCNKEYYAICDPQPPLKEMEKIAEQRGYQCYPGPQSAG